MALVNLNTIQFYQPPTDASLPRERVPKPSNVNGPTVIRRGKSPKAPRPSNGWSALWDDDPIEFIDMIDSPSREHFNPFHEPVQGPKDPKVDAGDEIYFTGNSQDRDDLPTLAELLLNAGDMRNPEQAGSKSVQREGLLKYAMKEDCSGVISPNLRRGRDKEKLITLDDKDGQRARREAGGSIVVVHTSDGFPAGGQDEEKAAVHPGNSIMIHATDDDDTDTGGFTALRKEPKPIFSYPSGLGLKNRDNRANLTRNDPGSPADPITVQDQEIDSSDGASEEQDGSPGSLSTPLTSVVGSEAGHSIFHQKSKHDALNTSYSNHITLSSTLSKRACGSKGGNYKDLTSYPSMDGNEKNPWNYQDAEADDKEEAKEKHNRDSDQKTMALLRFTKKRGLSTIKGRSASKCRVKRRRFSSPSQDEAVGSQDNIFAIQDQDLDTQADGTSPKLKGVRPRIPNVIMPQGPNSDTTTNLPTVEQTQGQGDAAQVKEQEWEITKILDKRETMSGTEYMVRWTNTWLPKGELGNARKLLREFEVNAEHGMDASEADRLAQTTFDDGHTLHVESTL